MIESALTASPFITISRDGSEPLNVAPGSIELDPGAFGLESGPLGHFRLRVPPGWSSEPLGPLRWRVRPQQVNPDRPAAFWLESLSDLRQRWKTELRVDLDLRSTFDPACYRLPLRNRAVDLGDVVPRREIFERTFAPMPEPLERLLFHGLYSDIVFLRADGPRRGGLCSGMARWAIARWQEREPPPVSTSEAIARITLYHGRQLCDRALLSALPWS